MRCAIDHHRSSLLFRQLFDRFEKRSSDFVSEQLTAKTVGQAVHFRFMPSGFTPVVLDLHARAKATIPWDKPTGIFVSCHLALRQWYLTFTLRRVAFWLIDFRCRTEVNFAGIHERFTQRWMRVNRLG